MWILSHLLMVLSFLSAAFLTAVALADLSKTLLGSLLLTINPVVFVMGNERGASNKANKTITCRHPCRSIKVSSIFGSLAGQFFYGEIYYCFQPAFSSYPLLQLLN